MSSQNEVVLSRSPHDGELLHEGPADTVSAVERAVEQARSAGRAWFAMPDTARADALSAAARALENRRELLADLISREVGKPIVEAEGEVTRGAAILRYHAQTGLMPQGDVYGGPNRSALSYAVRRPRGVAGLITPWNFPVAIPLWKAAPALAAGNAVVLKPSPESTAVALMISEVLGECLPEGLFRVVTGHAATGDALVATADAVSFTGSTKVGAEIRTLASARAVPLQSELGGQNAALVLRDADVEAAATAIAAAAVSYAGQKCTATRRVIVEGDALAFAEVLTAAVARLKVGDPADRDTAVGPVIGPGAAADVRAAVAEAVELGGRRTGVGRPQDEDEGNYVRPSVLAGVATGRLVTTEVFGPAVSVHGVESLEGAVELANSVDAGLVASVHTSDLGRAVRAVEELEVGLVRVNTPTTGLDVHVPFGGTKGSSYGPSEQGMAAREFFTHWKTILIQT